MDQSTDHPSAPIGPCPPHPAHSDTEQEDDPDDPDDPVDPDDPDDPEEPEGTKDPAPGRTAPRGNDDEEDPEWTTDPREVSTPVKSLIHPKLHMAWTIHKTHHMHYIFDYITPARQWKRNTKYTERVPFVEYGRGPPWPDITETDEGDHPQKPYHPRVYNRKYRFKFPKPITAKEFLDSKAISDKPLRVINVGKYVKIANKDGKRLDWRTVTIPYIYFQLICQLLAEDEHAKDGTRGFNSGHEALRRQSYVRHILDFVGGELRRFTGAKPHFRSKVLNPILQRYIRGIPDGYTPVIRAAISSDNDPTIADVTEFYLSMDPVDPAYIPHYRRNLLYLVETRWYLGILRKTMKMNSIDDFNRVRDNHDKVMEALQEDAVAEGTNDDAHEGVEKPSKFNLMEVRVILNEGLEGFFAAELALVPELLKAVQAESGEPMSG